MNKTYYVGGSKEAEQAYKLAKLEAAIAAKAAAQAALVNAPGPSLLEILGIEERAL